jgi:hypothetical protein
MQKTGKNTQQIIRNKNEKAKLKTSKQNYKTNKNTNK